MKRGFTLAEVIISLLVVIVLMVLAVPILNKKIRDDYSLKAGQPWEWIGNTANAKFNAGGENIAALIGIDPGNVGDDYLPRMAIRTNNNDTDHVQFYQNDEKKGALAINSRGYFLGNYPKVDKFKRAMNLNGTNPGDADPYNGNVANTIAIGDVFAYGSNSVTIGKNTKAMSRNSVALGTSATVANGAVAIGTGTNTCAHCTYNEGNYTWVCKNLAGNDVWNYFGNNAVAIGRNAKAYDNSIAIGTEANAYYISKPSTSRSLAIGYNSKANAAGSFVIGNNSKLNGYTSSTETIITDAIMIAHNKTLTGQRFGLNCIGTTMSIPYNQKTILGTVTQPVVMPNDVMVVGTVFTEKVRAKESHATFHHSSDLRLKNLGKEYTSGMDKLNKLKIYNYSFKSDPSKKRIGVLAQQLMKIFPDAVSKDENGYYLMREEDIFYAMVNALKDFDKKIKNIITSISNINKDLSDMELRVKNLSKQTEKNAQEIKLLKQRVKKLESEIVPAQKKDCGVSE